MGGPSQPFLYDYDPVRYSVDDRLPPKLFDPKAVTRASFDKPKPKPKPDGPLVSFNVHPEYVAKEKFHTVFHTRVSLQGRNGGCRFVKYFKCR